MVREVIVKGNERTSENLIRTQLEVKTGDFLSLATCGRFPPEPLQCRRLFPGGDLREEIGAEGQGEQTHARQGENPATSGEKPMRLIVNVREIQPYEIRYGGFFDTERGPGGIVDISNAQHARQCTGPIAAHSLRQPVAGNAAFLQPASAAAFPGYARSQLRTSGRNGIQPHRNPIRSMWTALDSRCSRKRPWRKIYVLNYGYRIEKSRTYDPGRQMRSSTFRCASRA